MMLILQLSLAVWYIAKAAAGNPNIITGKNPAIYIPVWPKIPPSAVPQNLAISFIPATSNQNTEFNAWWRPNGINILFEKPYIPAPTAPVETISSPNETNPPYTTGHTNNNIIVATNDIAAVTMATHLLPLKNPKAGGNLVFLNLL